MSTTDSQSAAPPTAAAGSSAAAQAAAFAEDPRVHFDRTSGTWHLEQDDGTELEYDAAKGAWVSALDEDLVKAQQAAYSVAGVDEETPAAPVLKRTKKRKEPEDYTSSTVGSSTGPATKRGKKGDANGQAERKSKNTAVYVTGLPPDTDADELHARFSKFGLIEEDYEGSSKIKLYARDDGTFSGDALVVYFKEESVDLAVSLLDDDELRIGDPNTRMRVKRAEFLHKHEGEAKDGEAKPRKTMADKKKATRRIGKMQKKLGEWDDEDGFGPSITEEDKAPLVNKSRVVVLKYMFTLQELQEDASLLLDLKDDVREECSSLGEVTNVVLYDKEPEGVMTVKFRDPLSAQACIIKMNGRFFAGRRIEASLYAGKQRYKRSIDDPLEDGGDEGEKNRLDDFANWLMTEGD
ncbi:uncharacterized protein C8Q71DRAFT_749414 [Rhodofomes roseus]|uniref:RRM domain-containing protein n=1 Tax=Rhodofomes roseus TaxID=34475 RepID=A0A4Y9Y534_9APHY|nr:uncharacterized protein C8Q71DRAFT_749414 [Rhodofomes roseus]KAH9839417.1 hypothetical protein C8Q71DRAFT_749414 [Rhodofomes roseus]TFY57038.1 hypothetical protein EVJ58_g7266 [Rhodofomes roseus]